MKILFVLLFLAVCTNSRGEVITFDFEGPAGTTLNGSSSGLISATGSSVSLTLQATAADGVFNLGPAGFGIDNSEDDDADAFDQDTVVADAVTFEILSSSVPLQSLELTSLEFDRFSLAGNDQGLLVTPPFTPLFGLTGLFDDDDLSPSDVLTVNAPVAVADALSLIFLAGDGFGLEAITFNATAAAATATVPEPSAFDLLMFAAGGVLVWRRRTVRAFPNGRA